MTSADPGAGTREKDQQSGRTDLGSEPVTPDILGSCP